MKINLSTHNQKKFNQNTLHLLPIWLNDKNEISKKGAWFNELSKVTQQKVVELLTSKAYAQGTAKEIHDQSGGVFFVVGRSNWNISELTLTVRSLVMFAKKENIQTLAISLDEFVTKKLSIENVADVITQNLNLANYDFSRHFKSEPKSGWSEIKEVLLYSKKTNKKISEQIKSANITAEAINRCRTLANYPPSLMTPEGLALSARDVAREVPAVKVSVFDEKKLKKEGMNAILAVGGGSSNPPRLIILEYKGAKNNKLSLALVGKGITFDSGGLNVKTPSVHMMDMHMDMSGGAAVISALYAIAKLKLPINVTGFVSAAENMISGSSYHQRDIITAYGGKTIEIGNTDAEGRVVLSDAIEYAKTKKPEFLITIATLTGAAVVALGERFTALFVKDNLKLRDALEAVGQTSGDPVWPLPLTKENEKDVEAPFADVINTHKKDSHYGGASSGAAFLSIFAGDQPFAHLDMAPRMTANPEEELLTPGARGFGVAYFVELAKNWENIKKTLR